MNSQKSASGPAPYRLCKLYHYNYNPRKKWLLCYYQFNIKTQKAERRVFTGFNNIPDGKQRLIEARRWEIFINQQLVGGKVYDPDFAPQTVVKKADTLILDFERMIEAKTASLSKDTIDAYTSFWGKFSDYLHGVGQMKVLTKDVTPDLCLGFQDYLLSLKLSNKTRNNYTGCLKSLLTYYSKPGRKRFLVSPAIDLENLPVESESDEPFTAEQSALILTKIEEKGDWQLLLFIYFILYTFARPGKEIRFMKVKDLKERTVIFGAKTSKTNLQKSPTITKALAELIERLGIKDFKPDLYVFTTSGTPGPSPVGSNYFYKRHRAILKELGILGKYTLYSWKYTGNIRLFAAGANLKSIQRQNGHTNLRTTERYLNRLGQFVDEEIFDKFV